MSPLVYLLSVVGAIALLFGGIISALAFLVGWLERHRPRRRDEEQERRLAVYAEHVAAQNGRPHTDAIVQRATRHHHHP